jgi:hypothetical protein
MTVLINEFFIAQLAGKYKIQINKIWREENDGG